ncbi:MAG: FMN-binding protein [Bacteroidales bacterium]|nr:FMN-binding protein [Bacteroidales bacterium]
MKILLILFFITVSMVSDEPVLSRDSSRKLNQTLTSLNRGVKVELIRLDLAADSITDIDIVNADGKWFAVRTNGISFGWLMADKIWGRYHEFEYAMIVDTNLKIIEVTILNYPDSHGGAVKSKNWLSGFNGISPDHIPVYGESIDAVSGATISGTSLTESVAESLTMLQKLYEQNLLR